MTQKFTLEQRYFVEYASHGNGYAVWDSLTKQTVYGPVWSKPEAIRKSQELNGYMPADGDERTYGKQTGLATAK